MALAWTIFRVDFPLADQPGFDAPFWRGLPALEVSRFLPQSSEHHPLTSLKLGYTSSAIHGLFHVEDRFVKCTHTENGSEVWKDSCVELFLEPKPGCGYFNFEFNCAGVLLVHHIRDPARVPGGFRDFTPLSKQAARQLKVQSSLAGPIADEITRPMTWELRFEIPLAFLEERVGPLGDPEGQQWRGNAFKCAEDNSHPHWASWSPVDEFNFHLPRCFGELHFK